MAIMTDADRFEAWAEFMRSISGDKEPISITKTDLRAALNAVDQWVSDNSASFNAAIPQPARNQLTASQKARLLLYVVSRRFRVGV